MKLTPVCPTVLTIGLSSWSSEKSEKVRGTYNKAKNINEIARSDAILWDYFKFSFNG